MGFRNFRVQVVWRASLLFILLLVLASAIALTDWVFTPLVFGVLALFSLVNLIVFVERTNWVFTEFLNAIYYQDFSTKVPVSNTGKPFKQLSEAYGLITESFRRITYQKEEYLNLLEAIVDHLQVAVICVDGHENIKLMNRAAKRLFKTPHLHRLEGLARIDPFILSCVQKLVPGEQQLLTVSIKGNPASLSLTNNLFRVADMEYRLLAFHNIRDELELKESEAWQKLIRVLAHEIMNSATPILSLSSSIKSMVSTESSGDFVKELSGEEQQDVLRGLESIENRSQGLIQFVSAYRDLTQIPEPRSQVVDLKVTIQNVTQLLMPELNTSNVSLDTEFAGGNLAVRVDPQQIEQVLINLLRNAMQAVEEKSEARIRISVTRDYKGKILVDVADNGMGIAEDNLANIFMPFYTTKTKGTGVGLSVSRQIMFMNRGLLTADSKQGVGSRFRLEFLAS